MKKTTHSLALRIAQILEEHTAAEVSEAIAILKRCGTKSELLAYLAAATRKESSQETKKASGSGGTSKPIDQVTSKVVRDLEKSDPAKHQLLSELDKLVRQGRVLETNEALRRFGETVSKNFRPKTNRKDNISALMAILAPLPEIDLEQLIKDVLDNSPKRQSDEYQKLASFLIRGRRE
jgi:hypothetical protein